ncbi:hypothetical protein [Polynucleobacter kasalickyi]|uniref:Uncharacterized protein n=1 Tax=Polynucleobacter kasalickyi TaxID=1938817 RepID=A0A1W2BMR3_9BURK|nr:hypothetical protein [Polynucleobacter kasalickyi]SMC74219.1 hypothetical protein SAMN06296008_11437 [Polynucleobacter kasalickyi]
MKKFFYVLPICLFILTGCNKNAETKIVFMCKGLLSSSHTQNNGTTLETPLKEINPTLTVSYIPVSTTNELNKKSDVWLIESDNPDFTFVTNNHRSENVVEHMSVVVDEKSIRVNSSYLTQGHDKTVKLLINRSSGEIVKEEVNFVPEYTNPQVSSYKGICEKG